MSLATSSICVLISQHDHCVYLCMGTNNSLSLQESWNLPPSSISLARQTLSSLARVTTPPCLPSFLTLPLFLPFSHFTHLQPEGIQKEMESRAQLSQQHRSRRQAFKTSIFTSGLVPWHQPTCPPNSICMETTITEGAPVAEGLDQRHWRFKKKNDRDRNMLITGKSLRVHNSRVVDSRQNLDVNQSN